MTIWIDHVIYAVRDLDAAGREFERRFGLASVPGGRHPGWGTANRIIPLGKSYLELIAAVDPGEAAASEIGRPVLEAATQGERLLGWVLATDEIERVAGRLDLEVTRGSRTRPDGIEVRWRLAGFERGLLTGAFPFFIQWEGPADLHPGAVIAEQRSSPQGIAWVEVSADERALREWLGEAELDLRIKEGPPALIAAGVRTENGVVVVR